MWEDEWIEEETLEQAVERLSRFLGLYMEINPEVRDTIARHVQERLQMASFGRKTMPGWVL